MPTCSISRILAGHASSDILAHGPVVSLFISYSGQTITALLKNPSSSKHRYPGATRENLKNVTSRRSGKSSHDKSYRPGKGGLQVYILILIFSSRDRVMSLRCALHWLGFSCLML